MIVSNAGALLACSNHILQTQLRRIRSHIPRIFDVLVGKLSKKMIEQRNRNDQRHHAIAISFDHLNQLTLVIFVQMGLGITREMLNILTWFYRVARIFKAFMHSDK